MDLLGQFNLITYVRMRLGSLNLDFTNSSFAMMMCVAIFAIIVLLRMRGLIIDAINVYVDFIDQLIIDNAGKQALFAAPFISSLFIFVCLSNLLGLVPNLFTATSHIVTNLTISAIVLLYIIFTGFRKNGMKFLSVFCPSGVPIAISPLIIIIEVLSFALRAVSLALRLTINMFVGHLIMKVLLYLSVQFGYFGCMIWPMYIAILFFEFAIALLHAYIFTFLTCMYLKDAIESHH